MTSILVGLIGEGIGQSKTPMLHETEGAAQGLSLSYELIDMTVRGVGVEALPALLAEAQARGFAGLNITHPCKQRVIPLLDALSDDARALGAVNTVVFKDGKRIGHNTDWSGFMEGFERGLPGVKKTTVLQLGAGGAGSAVAHACLKLGVETLVIFDVDSSRAAQVAQSLNERAGRAFATTTTDLAATMAVADGVINTTPIGMDAHPGMALPAELITNRHWVAEIVYFPLETALLREAKAKGCQFVNGGGMAVFQAVGAFRLFTGIEPDAERMRETFLSSYKS